jgi:3-hydroxyacyl-[acyl-carrier-protein] dehydratase
MADQRPDILDGVIQIIRTDLKLGDAYAIEADTRLFGGDLDLDSLDALLLITSMEKRFGVVTPREKLRPQVFATPRTIAQYMQSLMSAERAGAGAGPTAGPDLGALLSLLPHGEPFRFVTELRGIEPGRSGEGVWRVTGEEPFFRGHFPGRPIVPGVLLTEALAQLSGLVAASGMTAAQRVEGRLAQMDVRCGATVSPPAEIVLRSVATRQVQSLHQFDVQALVDSAIAAEGRVTIKIVVAGAPSVTEPARGAAG